ncbi:MAG: hypothetical protein JNK48_02630 [Bryobacterales bacterium]|nr:hypothetical protein [Bryobacterales bacterium]
MPEIPVQFPGQQVFDRARAFFETSDFNEAHFNRLRSEWKQAGFTIKPGALAPKPDSRAHMLTLLFNDAAISESDFVELGNRQALDDLKELGMVVCSPAGVLTSTVRTRPFRGLYVICDHEPPNRQFADDFVFPPDDTNTFNYLRYVAFSPCEAFLEACGGSGIAALIAASRCAERSWSSDLAERSTVFARFSAALSGLSNFTAVRGDTYEPVQDRVFDRIAVHPPYVPVLRHSFIFHGGGLDGEQITRKHITDLHGRLKPGGRLYCRCGATDRKGAPLEMRIRQWLGEHESEYDIALQVLGYVEPWRFLMKSVRTGRTRPEELAEWGNVLEELQLETLLMCVFVVQRHEEKRTPFTVRREEGPYSGPKELDWLLEIETARSRQGVEHVLSSRLKVNPTVTLSMVNSAKQGEWELRSQFAEVVHPHPLKMELDPLSAFLLPGLNGQSTGRELFHSLVEQGAISPDDPQEAIRNFATGLLEMASSGLIFVEGLEPPAPVRNESRNDL